jgi:uncharacterized OB-fold protein
MWTTDVPTASERPIVGGEWLVAIDDGGLGLRVSRCPACQSRWFPPRTVCSTCTSEDLEQRCTSSRGVAYASTVVRVGASGFVAPYVLSYVDVDGVRVLAHTVADGALPPDTDVELMLARIGHDGDEERWSYAVRPVVSEP